MTRLSKNPILLGLDRQIQARTGDLTIPSEHLGLDRQIQARTGDSTIPSEHLGLDCQIRAKTGDLTIPSEHYWTLRALLDPQSIIGPNEIQAMGSVKRKVLP